MDHFLIIGFLGGLILLQLYWTLTDPRNIKDRMLHSLGMNKNPYARLSSLIVFFIILIAVIHPAVLKGIPLQLPHTIYDGLLIILGIMLYLFGGSLALWARIVMKEKWLPAGSGHDKKRQNELFTRGPFRFTRNPIYLGMLLMYTGIFVGLRSPLLIFVAFPLIIFNKSARKEETYLTKQFGDKYLSYKKSVPRFLFKEL